MKHLTIAVVLLTLAGCQFNVKPVIFEAAKNTCINNGGVDWLKFRGRESYQYIFSVQCNDGAFFETITAPVGEADR